MFYSNTTIAVSNSPVAWVHNLVSNASASGVSLTAANLVARATLVNSSATQTGFPVLLGPLASNTLTVQMNLVGTLVSCQLEIQAIPSIIA